MKDINQLQEKEKKRVHWPEEAEPELKAHEKSKSRKKPKYETVEDKKLYELGKIRWERFVDERDYNGLLKYCKDLAAKSKIVQKARNEYGDDSEEAIRAEKKSISYYLSAFDNTLFRKACVKNDVEFIVFLACNFTEHDLKANILYRSYSPFCLYLTRNKHCIEPFSRKEFIKGLKIFFSIVDTTEGALNHYIKQIAGEYDARPHNREDFVTALKQAEEDGIIKNIDLAEIQAIQDSYKEKDNMTNFSFVERLREERDSCNKDNSLNKSPGVKLH